MRSRAVTSIVIIFSLAFFMACESVEDRKEEQRISILTIGNSFSMNACFYLSEMAASVPGCEIVITAANKGGCSLERHATMALNSLADSSFKPYQDEQYNLFDLLSRNTYDYVTIQQVSSSSFKSETFYPFADSIVNYIHEFAPDAKILVHQTWAYSDSCSRLDDFGISRDEMHAGILESYSMLAEKFGSDILPSGEAMYVSYNSERDIYLWKTDGFHANPNGCYLLGCVWFEELFGISPTKIRFVPKEEIDRRTAKKLRTVASEV